KEDWSIFRALSGVLGMPLPFNSLSGLRKQLYAEFPHLARLDVLEPADAGALKALAKTDVKTTSAPLTASPVADFYLSNPIARASAVMGECAQLAAGLKQAAE